jgi:hypothetical protein
MSRPGFGAVPAEADSTKGRMKGRIDALPLLPLRQ